MGFSQGSAIYLEKIPWDIFTSLSFISFFYHFPKCYLMPKNVVLPYLLQPLDFPNIAINNVLKLK